MVAELGILAQTSGGLGLGVERTEIFWLALGSVLMLLGMTYFISRGWGATGKQREYYGITIMITAIASASYLSMFFGFGLTEVTVGGIGTLDIYWARYADWLFTTPLLLLDLALLVDADRASVVNLVLVDAFMIVTGLVGALTKVYEFRFVWWFMSTVAMVFLLYFLYVEFTEKAQEFDEDTQATFIRLRNLVVLLWSAYPVVWLVGTEGLGVVGLFVETALFMVLDVLAKVGFGFILLRSRAVTDDGDEAPEPSAEVSPSADD